MTRRVTVVNALSIVVAVGLIGGGVGGVVWARDESLRAVRIRTEPLWAGVSPAPPSISETASFTVHRSDTLDVPAGSWTGTVTAVDLRVGVALVETSDAPVEVDGLARQWFAAASPLYRSIGSGAIGADVDALAAFLERAGFHNTHVPGTAVDKALVAVIRTWATWFHIDKRATAFDPAWVTWLPPALVGQPISEVDVVVGQAAPGGGSKVAVVGAVPDRLVPLEVGLSATPTSTPMQGAHDVVHIGVGTFPFVDGQPDADGLAALRALVAPDQTEVSLTIEHVLPADIVTVPSSALLVSGGGFCAVVSDSAAGHASRLVDVAVVASVAGTAVIADPGAFVLVNPADSYDGC